MVCHYSSGGAVYTMPRLKSKARSDAARQRLEERRAVVDIPQQFGRERRARQGTGRRHRVVDWPKSDATGRTHKMIFPAECADKKVVLVIGDSHLRAIVDGFVEMPEACMSFGFMAFPGARASQLRTEVHHAVVPLSPDVVCVLAPSNNITAGGSPDDAGVEFGMYLNAVCSRWQKVFVLDFPPRLNIDEDVQDLFRQEFHRVAARAGVKFYSIAERFPLKRSMLWSRDGVHLSDDEGMVLLVKELWDAAFAEAFPPAPQVLSSPRPSSPSMPAIVPRLVVKGKMHVARCVDPFKWRRVGNDSKQCVRALKRKHGNDEQRVNTSAAVVECCIPSNPQRFSSAVLAAMDDFVPSNLSRKGKKDHATAVVFRKREAQRKVMTKAPPPGVVADVLQEVPEMGVRRRRKAWADNVLWQL
ncbi:unnamed protein product [Pleuronectes platessa]|uniref:Uncharacterized protein n=1 Tax=Pleuronectes platessa TaxID=8262 RepID=A0A9N7V0K9_PLEPL|nr:unnamed protein product [Pleuronectes platessa]